MFSIASPRVTPSRETEEQAAMDERMQGLHPSVEHLGKSGVRGNVGHGQAGLAQRRRRAAGG
jgi:hypothetical protein